MIYISHLVLDDDMKALVKEYGTGIESIDFSISDNLDPVSYTHLTLPTNSRV